MDCTTHEWTQVESPEGGLYRCSVCGVLGKRSFETGEIVVEPCYWYDCDTPAVVDWSWVGDDVLLCAAHYEAAMQQPCRVTG